MESQNKLFDVVLLELDKPTKHSGRIYPKHEIAKAIEEHDTFILSFGMTEDFIIDLEKSVGVVRCLEIVDDVLLGDIEIKSTPCGKVLQIIIASNVSIRDWVRIACWCNMTGDTVSDIKIMGFVLDGIETYAEDGMFTTTTTETLHNTAPEIVFENMVSQLTKDKNV